MNAFLVFGLVFVGVLAGFLLEAVFSLAHVSDLESDNRRLEIEVARLKREAH